VAPDKVLAATYSWRTRSLYFLDEVDDGATVRLVAVHADTHHAAVLTSFPRDSAWSRQELVVDRDGALLLASSSPAEQIYAIARIDFHSESEPFVEVEVGSYPLGLPPLVDSLGYVLVLEIDGDAIERVRKPALDLEPPESLDRLGEQL
jgi:hypothetical protein